MASRDRRADLGQASVELLATIPVLIVVAAFALQLSLAGWSAWAAQDAARAGARAAHLGENGPRAALRALPDPLRTGAAVSGARTIEVRVSVPRLASVGPRLRVSGRSDLEPAGE